MGFWGEGFWGQAFRGGRLLPPFGEVDEGSRAGEGAPQLRGSFRNFSYAL
jgi:hypothetical protein